jgi:hypothetical protein
MNRSGARSPRSPAWWVGILGFITLVRCGGITAPSETTTEGLVIEAGASCPPNAKGQLHRCQNLTCPVSAVGQALPCKSDHDCDAVNEAGVLFQGMCRAGVCRFDNQCSTDSDCPSGTACSCAGDLGPLSAGWNSCVLAKCRTDSDCGPGGVCSPSFLPGPCGHIDGWFCHTPQDTCATDDDCALQTSGMSCEHTAASGSWTCVEPDNCPTSG